MKIQHSDAEFSDKQDTYKARVQQSKKITAERRKRKNRKDNYMDKR